MARTGFSEILNVSLRNNKSGSIINSFGTLIIETAEKKLPYRIGRKRCYGVVGNYEYLRKTKSEPIKTNRFAFLGGALVTIIE